MKIDDSVSDEKIILCGVPQGTVLGPILFNIYLNNLFLLNTYSKIISFADDTVVFCKDNDWFNLKLKLKHDLSKIKEWFDYRLLSINSKKRTTCLSVAMMFPFQNRA